MVGSDSGLLGKRQEEVARELSRHPQVLADVLSLSAASEGARRAVASERPFKGAGKVPCIEELLAATACYVPAESYRVTLGLLTLGTAGGA